VPLLHERDAEGLPRRWIQMMRASMRTAAIRFGAGRMLGPHLRSVYRDAG
jgi:starch phosphorylase